MNTGRQPLAQLLGEPIHVPLPAGGEARYVNLDNAATTPFLNSVWDRIAAEAPWYGSIHRGDGYKSRHSTAAFEQAKCDILRFAGGADDDDVLFLGVNTTSCVNFLARRLDLAAGRPVLVSQFEHSSNILPWQVHGSVRRFRAAADGGPDLDDLAVQLCRHRPGLVAIGAACNVTGRLNPVHAVARLAHDYGARVFVDAAQWAGHCRIDRRSPDDPSHLDFVAFAGHKMYAPMGIAALIAPRCALPEVVPCDPGGGSVRLLLDSTVIWEETPAADQGGTPNYLGALALAAAGAELKRIGFDVIAQHEQALLTYARDRLGAVPGLRLLGGAAPHRLAILPFHLPQWPSALVAAYLGREQGIGVRAGPLCQFSQVARLLERPADDDDLRDALLLGDQRAMYGVVRASCGVGTVAEDFDRLADALDQLVHHGPQLDYEHHLDGRFLPSASGAVGIHSPFAVV